MVFKNHLIKRPIGGGLIQNLGLEKSLMDETTFGFGLTESSMDISARLEQFELPQFVREKLAGLKSEASSKHQEDQRLKESLFLCDVLIDYSWEFLNTNIWTFVEDKWRLVYAYATLLKIVFLNKARDDAGENFEDRIVKLCDLGLLMSGPLLEKQFDTVIKSFRKQPTSKTKMTKDDSPGPKRAKVELTSNEQFLLKLENSPSIERFTEQYFKTATPLIIDGQMTHWPATQKWSIDYLLELAGNRTVPIEIGSKYTDTDWSQKLMTVREFINEYVLAYETDDSAESAKGYLAQHPLFDQIPELREDIYVPEYCYYLGASDVETTIDINAWFGPRGTVSPLHYDPKPNFLCQVIGEKYVRLYDERFSSNLYPHEGNILKNTSQIDVEKLDKERFPLAREVPFWEGILRPGQMLYIPPRCWHYIRSLSLSFSVSFWWQAAAE